MASYVWPSNGGSIGEFSSIVLDGSISGQLTLSAAATTASYSLVFPASQGGAGTSLVNDGSGNLTWGSAAGITIGALDAQAENANGLALVNDVLSSQSADATHPGMVNIATQSFAGAKIFANQLGVVSSTTPSATSLLRIGGGTNPLSGVSQIGIQSAFTGTAGATSSLRGFQSGVTQAGSITTTNTINYNCAAPVKGSGSTITNHTDFSATGSSAHVATNNACFSDNAIFTGNYFLFSNSGDPSALGGTLMGSGANGTVPLQGTNTNDSAASGILGEQIISRVTTNTNAPGATTAWGDCTSVSLTAGDWDVTEVVFTTLNGATMTGGVMIGISTTTGNSATGLQTGDNMAHFPVPSAATGDRSGVVAAYRISLAVTTTVYLKLNVTYSVGNPQYTCRLSARRVR